MNFLNIANAQSYSVSIVINVSNFDLLTPETVISFKVLPEIKQHCG